MHRRGWLISAIAVAGALHATVSLAQSHIGSAASAQNLVEGILAPSGSFLTGSFSSHVTDNILRVGVNYRFF
jgi:hypothetical protein